MFFLGRPRVLLMTFQLVYMENSMVLATALFALIQGANDIVTVRVRHNAFFVKLSCTSFGCIMLFCADLRQNRVQTTSWRCG